MEAPIPDELRNLVQACAAPSSAASLTWESRLVHDLGIMGDDFLDLLSEVNHRFKTDFSNFRWTDYAPSEGELLNLWPGERRIVADCKPMTLRQLYAAIEAGSWNESTPREERHIINPLLISLTTMLAAFGSALALVLGVWALRR